MSEAKKAQLTQQLTDGLEQLSLTLTEQQIAQLVQYVIELEKWNKTYNLTAVREANNIMQRHVFDALSVVKSIDALSPKILADIGTGGGIPGVILAIIFPKLSVHLVESIGKKCRFLRHIVQILGLSKHVDVVQQRVEQWRPEAPLSIIICRAFTSLQNFTTITAHLGDDSSTWLAMKSAHTQAEETLIAPPFSIVDNQLLTVPDEEAARHLITLKKQTSAAN